jgi:hypothetical protein
MIKRFLKLMDKPSEGGIPNESTAIEWSWKKLDTPDNGEPEIPGEPPSRPNRDGRGCEKIELL